jgi:hypothetical protein
MYIFTFNISPSDSIKQPGPTSDKMVEDLVLYFTNKFNQEAVAKYDSYESAKDLIGLTYEQQLAIVAVRKANDLEGFTVEYRGRHEFNGIARVVDYIMSDNLYHRRYVTHAFFDDEFDAIEFKLQRG